MVDEREPGVVPGMERELVVAGMEWDSICGVLNEILVVCFLDLEPVQPNSKRNFCKLLGESRLPLETVVERMPGVMKLLSLTDVLYLDESVRSRGKSGEVWGNVYIRRL